MKTVKKNEEIKRVSDKAAANLVEGYGWSYCQKKEWKTSVRDVKALKVEELKIPDSLTGEDVIGLPVVREEKKKVQGRQRQKQLGEN